MLDSIYHMPLHYFEIEFLALKHQNLTIIFTFAKETFNESF